MVIGETQPLWSNSVEVIFMSGPGFFSSNCMLAVAKVVALSVVTPHKSLPSVRVTFSTLGANKPKVHTPTKKAIAIEIDSTIIAPMTGVIPREELFPRHLSLLSMAAAGLLVARLLHLS